VLVLPSNQDGLAEFMLVSPQQLMVLPKDINADLVLMTQLLGTVIHCVRKIGNVVGDTIAVVGQGPVGLLFTALLRNLGAQRIVGIDRLPERLEVSRRMGATHVVDGSRTDAVAALLELTGGNMADMAVEAAGTEEAGNLCIDLVRHDGTVVQFGVQKKQMTGWAINKLLHHELRVISSLGPDRDYGLARDFIVQGRIDVRPLITHHVPFEKIQGAFDLAYGRKDGVVKVVVVF
ncbi:MAG: zinc-binding dehydrogenase, partial [Candidatus Latescibacterota bacterium]